MRPPGDRRDDDGCQRPESNRGRAQPKRLRVGWRTYVAELAVAAGLSPAQADESTLADLETWAKAAEQRQLQQHLLQLRMMSVSAAAAAGMKGAGKALQRTEKALERAISKYGQPD